MLNSAKKNTYGFTLVEMLFVVTIIAILVAVAVPIYTRQQEKTRETADLASIRSAYALILAEAITKNNPSRIEIIPLQQEKDGWQTADFRETLESLGTVVGAPTEGGLCEVSWLPEEKKVLISFN